VTGSLSSLVYGVVNTTLHGWTSSTTLTWFAVGAVGLAVFLAWESKVASHPLVPFRIFRSRALTTANLVMLLVGGTFFAMWYFLTFYFQYILGYGAVKTGVAFFPMAVAIILGAQVSSRILARVHVRPLLLAGTSLGTFGFLWLSQIRVDSSYLGNVLAPASVCAFAMGLLFTPLASAATTGVDRAEAGLASGVLNTARQVGGSLALAILATVAADRSANYLNRTSPGALVSGYQRAFEVSALVILAALAITLAVPRRIAPHPNH
jgi:Na+/melibiose symporter-like transporter